MDDWVGLIRGLREFASGNTLVLLYLAVVLTKTIFVPLYRSGREIKAFVASATKALNEGVFSHREIVSELKALNVILSERQEK